MLAQLNFLLPEIILASSIGLVLLADCNRVTRVTVYPLVLLALILPLAFLIKQGVYVKQVSISNMFEIDSVANLLRISILIILFLIFTYSRSYIDRYNFFRSEYFALVLLSTLGMMFLIVSSHFLSLYLALELFALPVYAIILIGNCGKNFKEAGIKYFVMGALASGMLLYGISIIYGVTGSLEFTSIANAIAKGQSLLALNFGMVFVLAGIAFKLGAVPFHMWLPDVYEGAASPVGLFVATVAKIAAFAMMYRVLARVFPGMHANWQPLLQIIALASIALGNTVALVQTNLKRLLAYSTMSHVGFVLLALSVGNNYGYAAGMYYMLVYAFMLLGIFGIMLSLSSKGSDADELNFYTGLASRHPVYAAILLLLLLSLAGFPPFIGFFIKFYVLKALLAAKCVWQAVVAMLFAVVGAFYYLKVVRLMYFETKAKEQAPIASSFAISSKLLLSLNGIVMLLLSGSAGICFYACYQAF